MHYGEFEIKQLSIEQLADVYYLFKESRNMHFPHDFFEKKYAASCSNIPAISLMAYDKQHKPVAHCAVIPLIARQAEQDYLIGQLCDVITHPEYRGKGLISALIETQKELARTSNIHHLYVFPNKNLYPLITKKLNWEVVHQMNYYSIPVSCIPFNKIANKFNLRNFYEGYLRIFSWFIRDKRKAFNGSAKHYPGIIKNTGFLKWKTYSISHRIRLAETYIWFKTEDGMWIGDIENVSKENFYNTIKTLKLVCFFMGYHKLKFTVSPGSFLDELFKTLVLPDQHGYGVLHTATSAAPSDFKWDQIVFTSLDFNTF